MDPEDHYSPSSSCSSSSSSSPSMSASPKAAAAAGGGPSPKRKAGRKKFRETRHPVYHGVRERDGGKWVSEVREPRKKSRIWLGTYQTPEMAAMAHDVAAVTLRGDAAHLNFPDLTLVLPRARSAAAADVRLAAAEAARMFGPSVSLSSTSSSRSPPPPTAPPQCRPVQEEAKEAPRAAPQQQPPPVFLDEEALFNMPGLLEDMARGLLVTPPAWQERFDWDAVKDFNAVDVWPLWTDDADINL